MARLKLLIADDHTLVLAGVQKLLEGRFDVIGAVTDGHALLKAAEQADADIILVDLAMPQLNGLDAIERLKIARPAARILVFTMNEDPDIAGEAMNRGASGYLLKTATQAELFEAIQEVAEGRLYISPRVSAVPPRVFASDASRRKRGDLSLRQREVLQLLAEGRSMKEAADVLGVTPRTIAFHKYAIMDRLGLKTSADLVQHAVRTGLVAGSRPRN